MTKCFHFTSQNFSTGNTDTHKAVIQSHWFSYENRFTGSLQP